MFTETLTVIFDQHRDLRDRMERCERLADELDAGYGAAAVLLREVGELRAAFAEHNRFEERHLRPMFSAESVADHLTEHRVMAAQLNVTSELRATITRMRAHLDAEERYFETIER
jgi:hypothetical protein